jgi:beta-glucosidase/6-phospho-beta-glucosidase/beta-galactosidase
MQSILMAMSEGVNVVGTLAWSIFDNFGTSRPQADSFSLLRLHLKSTDLVQTQYIPAADELNFTNLAY